METIIKLFSMLIILTSMSVGTFAEDCTKLDEDFVKATNHFGLKLLEDIKEPNKNIMISAVSLQSALGTLSGAGKEPEIQSILKTLDMNIPIDKLNQNNQKIIKLCKNPGENITLNMSTSIWIADHLKINKNYGIFLDKYYNSDINKIDFKDSQKAADRINNWCLEKTNKMINKTVDPDDIANSNTVICNALYFFGQWTTPFNSKFTFDGQFKPYKGSQINIKMMSKTENYKYIRNDNYDAISLPYGKTKDFAIDIIIPKDQKAMDICLNHLKEHNTSIFNNERYNEDKVEFIMPKFQIDYRVSLINILKKYGLQTSGYKNMLQSKEINQISQILHVTKLKVNEEGTEAAAVTAIIAKTAMRDEIVITADKPFIFYIYDTKNNLMFFTGIINAPQGL